MMIRGYEIGGRIIAMVVGVVILIVAAGIFLRSCQSAKTAKKEAEVAQGQSGATISTAEEVGNTVSNVAAGDAATDALVAGGQAEIAKAVKGQKGAATKRAACRLEAYRDSPQCKEPVR